MPNEKVSNLTALTAGEISSGDLFLVSDISSKESKKMEASQLLLFFEVSGTFNAATAVLADTASYILGSNVIGAVVSSSYSNTASYALTANNVNSASHSETSSMTLTCVTHTTTADTASFLLYSPTNGTASYSISSSIANYALTSSTLLYVPGISRNTASYAITASYSSTSSLSVSSSYSTTSSYSYSSSFAPNSISSSYSLTASNLVGYSNTVKAWCSVSWSVGANYPQQIASSNIKPQLGDGIENGGGIQYLSLYAPVGSHYVALFGVNFQTPLSSSKYSFIGIGSTYMDPIVANPTIYGFTMSIDAQAGAPTNWYNTPPGSRAWTVPAGFTSFTIFG